MTTFTKSYGNNTHALACRCQEWRRPTDLDQHTYKENGPSLGRRRPHFIENDASSRTGLSGLHILLHLPDGTDTCGTVRAAAAAGLRLADLDDYRTKRSAERALVLGYGNISDTEIPPAVTLLREALRSPVESAAWSGVS
jgi:hypothetical protein